MSLNANTSGVNNTAIGYQALLRNTTGTTNFALGLNALQLNTTGSNNTAIGSGALNQNNADENIAIGRGCMYWVSSTTASNNVAIGTNAFGSFSLYGSATCANNVAIGYLSGGGNNNSYNYNTLIGANTDTSGNLSYATAIGYNAIATTSNQIMLGGNASGTYPNVVVPGNLNIANTLTINNAPGTSGQVLTSQGSSPPIWSTIGNSAWIVSGNNIYYNTGNVGIGTTDTSTYALSVAGSINATVYNASSDYRIKDNIQLLNENFTVDSLKPVTYINKKTGSQDIGLIAHELQEEYPFLVAGEKDGPEMQSVNYIGLIGILIKEIQDLKKEVSTFKKG